MLRIYAPNGAKDFFFKELKERLRQEVYDQMIMMGDINGVVRPQLDKSLVKAEGKLPFFFFFFELINQEDLEDIWRQ